MPETNKISCTVCRQNSRMYVFIFLVCCLLQYKCESVNKCLDTPGEVVAHEKEIAFFHTLLVHDDIHATINYDTTQKVIVETGENLMQWVTSEVSDKHLILSNTNHCHLRRGYDVPIEVYISNSNFGFIGCYESCILKATNTIVAPHFFFDLGSCNGSICFDLLTKDAILQLSSGTADIVITGKGEKVTVNYRSTGKVNLTGLQIKYLKIESTSCNDISVLATDSLQATIKNIGNIYYTGKPKYIIRNGNGKGKLLPL